MENRSEMVFYCEEPTRVARKDCHCLSSTADLVYHNQNGNVCQLDSWESPIIPGGPVQKKPKAEYRREELLEAKQTAVVAEVYIPAFVHYAMTKRSPSKELVLTARR